MLIDTFGIPKVGYNRKDWYSVSKFLQSSPGCWVTRVVGPNAANAVATADGLANVLGKEVFIPSETYFNETFINGAPKVGTSYIGVATPATAARGGSVTYTLPSMIRINDRIKFTIGTGTEQVFTVVDERSVDELIVSINGSTATQALVVASKDSTGKLVLTAKDISENMVGSYSTDVATETAAVITAPTSGNGATGGKATFALPVTIRNGDKIKFSVNGGADLIYTTTGSSTLDSIVTAINADTDLNALVTASSVSGALVLTTVSTTATITGYYASKAATEIPGVAVALQTALSGSVLIEMPTVGAYDVLDFQLNVEGKDFGTHFYIEVEAQTSIADVIATINEDARMTASVTAAEVGGKLKLTAVDTLKGVKGTFQDNIPGHPVDFIAKYPGSLGNGIEVHILDTFSFGTSPYAPIFDGAPSGTEVHVVIAKDGEILERYDFLNTLEGTRKIDGTKAYYVDVLNEMSKYVYITNPCGACSVLLRGGTLGATFAQYGSINDPMNLAAPAMPLARSLYPATGNGVRIVIVDRNNYSTQTANIKTALDTEVGGGAGSGQPGFDGVAIVVFEGPYIRETHVDMVKDWNSVDYFVNKFNAVSAYADLLDVDSPTATYPVDFTKAAMLDFTLTGATRDLHPQNFPGYENVQIDGYDAMKDFETYDYGMLIQGAASNFVGSYLVELAEIRKFTVAFVSPQYDSVKQGGSASLAKVLNDRQQMYSVSYGYMDSNWAMVYDRFNKTTFWMPMNPITAALNAKVESDRFAWYVGYGFNYGKIAGIVKLAWEQPQGIRDELYKSQVNPVTTFRNEGPTVFGSKTLQAKPSAFDRLNVRRLFIYCELAISRTMKYYIGELNTPQTRLRVLNTVAPFLRDVQSKQGVYDFFLRCDEKNNTPYVIDTNQLALDVALKPSRVIDFVSLSFYAVPTGVEFSEVFQ
jgi:hypothetical protein